MITLSKTISCVSSFLVVIEVLRSESKHMGSSKTSMVPFTFDFTHSERQLLMSRRKLGSMVSKWVIIPIYPCISRL